MNFISELFKNPLIKILAVVVVFYFGLYKNKESPESLGNRLSSDNIKKNVSEVKERTHFIVTNLKVAQEYKVSDSVLQKLSQEEIEKIDLLQYKDEKEGEGIAVKCGDEVEISYGVYDKKTEGEIEFIKNKKLTIGSNENIFFERKIIGMKKGATRTVNIPHKMETEVQELKSFLKYSTGDLFYRINLINFVAKNNCN